MGKEVMEIIRSDYDGGMSFTLIEFHYQEGVYLMGSCVVPPEAEERKENISFVFQDQVFEEFEEFLFCPFFRPDLYLVIDADKANIPMDTANL